MFQSVTYNTAYWKCFTAQPHLLQLAHDVSVDNYGEPCSTGKSHLSDITCLLGKLRIEDVAHLDQKTSPSSLGDHINDHINEDVLKSCLKYSKEVEKLSSEKKPACRRRRPRRLPDIPHIQPPPPAPADIVAPRLRSPVNTFSLAAELRQVGASCSLGKHDTARRSPDHMERPHSIHDHYEEDNEDSRSERSQNTVWLSGSLNGRNFGRNDELVDGELKRVYEGSGVSALHGVAIGDDTSSGSKKSEYACSAHYSPWTKDKSYSLRVQPAPTDSLVDVSELEASHRGCHKFVPRHAGEMFIEIGDPIYVEIEADDLWCEGINLRSRKRGIFPAAYATDLSFLETGEVNKTKPRKFHVRFLGSIEVNYHKGNDILARAINQVTLSRRSVSPPRCCLEVNEYGIKMTDESKKDTMLHKNAGSTTSATKASITQRLMKMLSKERSENGSDHFFSLKNISFCGYHPVNNRYFGFITKHPLDMRFACHVFLSETSTVNISEAVGEAFRRFYQQYMAFVHPTEDIYLE